MQSSYCRFITIRKSLLIKIGLKLRIPFLIYYQLEIFVSDPGSVFFITIQLDVIPQFTFTVDAASYYCQYFTFFIVLIYAVDAGPSLTLIPSPITKPSSASMVSAETFTQFRVIINTDSSAAISVLSHFVNVYLSRKLFHHNYITLYIKNKIYMWISL